MKEGKTFEISKYQVMEAYKCLKANHGAAGTDGVNFAKFDKDLKSNLYKIWNRMSSGCYFPIAVRGVEILKIVEYYHLRYLNLIFIEIRDGIF